MKQWISMGLVVTLLATLFVPMFQVNAQPTAGLLTNIPVSGTVMNPPMGTAPDFTGTLSITRFSVDQATRELFVDGVITGTIGDQQNFSQNFTRIPATLSRPGMADAGTNLIQLVQVGRCDILNLDLGPINLNVLGLVIQTNRIQLDIFALQGPGNLLGNLLCALVGLLDQPQPGGLLALINRINQLLGGLRSGLRSDSVV